MRTPIAKLALLPSIALVMLIALEFRAARAGISVA